jgi:DNA-directed RNA polymerase specialized sigma24 family protein
MESTKKHLQRIQTELLQSSAASSHLAITNEEILLNLFSLPVFLREACCYHFYFDDSFAEIATTLNISECLAKQRIAISIALLRILYASKPKNPV